MEKLTKLNVFSFGKNLVKNHETAIQYLKGLHNNLEVLNMAENPFMKAGGGPATPEDYKNFKYYAIEMLKKLKYLDYELINAQQRDLAKQKYNDEAQDKDQNANSAADDSKNLVDQELRIAKIEYTHKMIERIQDEFDDIQKIKIISKYQDAWSNFEQPVDELTTKFQTEIKVLSKEKQRYIVYCDATLRKAELQAEAESIEKI